MKLQKQRDFLTQVAYWAVIAAGVFFILKYLLPISMPCILGVLVAWMIVGISRKLGTRNKFVRLGLTCLIYGIMGLLISLVAVKAVSGVSSLVKWFPELYELKLLPFVMLCYEWFMDTVEHLDPALIGTLEMVGESLVSALKNLITSLSAAAVDLVSKLATGVPSLVLSLLAMIFSTVFVVADYERIAAFTADNLPESAKKLAGTIRIYLTDTLFVVIRSYVLIMLLTFTELSILFSLFGIEHPVVKAALIAVFDILPILGTGGIMIPWAVISLVLGYTKLGIVLFIIYGIVTVIRNYVEPRIVGIQLGLHPIITLVSMFVGLRLFGFWGLFGLPVGISFLWKQKQEREEKTDQV